MPEVKEEFDYLKGGSSASYLFNNLHLCPSKLNGLLYLSWIHNSVKGKSEVNMITFQNLALKNSPDYKTYRLFYPEGDLVTTAKWLWLDSQKDITKQIKKNDKLSEQAESQLQKNLIFCLCSTTGLVKLYSANGELLILSKLITPWAPEKENGSSDKAHCSRESNMCVTSNGTDTLYFATKGGGLLLVKPFGEYSKKFIKMSQPISQLEFHRESITLIIGNLLGHIQVLEPNTLAILHRFTVSNQSMRNIVSVSSITCMCCGDTYLLAGYMCGRIRLFDMVQKTLLVEICSHTRSVSAVDLDERSGHFVSAAEDTFVNLFKFVKCSSGGFEVNVSMSKQIANAVLVGVQLVHSTLLVSGNENRSTLKGILFTQYDSFKVGLIPVH